MRRKTATTGLLVLGVVTVLAMLGFVYGSWEEEFNVRGRVETGDVSVNPQIRTEAAKLNDKQVARCKAEAAQEVNKKTLIEVNIRNGYPGFVCRVHVDLVNKSTVPVVVSGYITHDPDALAIRIKDPAGTNKGDCSAILNPTQGPNHELCTIDVLVTKKAEQNKTGDKAYRFLVELSAELKGKPNDN